MVGRDRGWSGHQSANNLIVRCRAQWIFDLFLALAMWFARMARMRVVADERGIELFDVFVNRFLSWSEIQRFEVSNVDRRAVAVTHTGRRFPLIGSLESPIERLRSTESATAELANQLNIILEERQSTMGSADLDRPSLPADG
jgi:Bacterial PH domain